MQGVGVGCVVCVCACNHIVDQLLLWCGVEGDTPLFTSNYQLDPLLLLYFIHMCMYTVLVLISLCSCIH